ncbi:WhiB family transcriptional regulator [Dermatophilaceae bacterium Soc4.6]
MIMRASVSLPPARVEAYEWQEQGRCRGMDSEKFFTDDRDQNQKRRVSRTRDAKELCSGCPVITQCLEHALAVPENHGIWGGTTAAERQRMLWQMAG